jgi:hypothetical protein
MNNIIKLDTDLFKNIKIYKWQMKYVGLLMDRFLYSLLIMLISIPD